MFTIQSCIKLNILDIILCVQIRYNLLMLNTNVTIYTTGRLGLCVGDNTIFRVGVGGNAKKVNI